MWAYRQLPLRRRLWAPLLLAVAAAAAAGAAEVVPAGGGNVTVAALVGATNPWAVGQPEARPLRAAMRLAAARVNADAELLPNHTLVLRFEEVPETPAAASVLAVDALAEEGVAFAALVGGPYDALAVDTAYAAAARGLPHVDLYGTGAALWDAEAFPRLARMSPGVQVEVNSLLRTLDAFGWAHVGVVTGMSTSANELLEVLTHVARRRRVRVGPVVRVPVGRSNDRFNASSDGIARALAGVSAQETRVWLLNVRGSEGIKLLLALDDAGLFDDASGIEWVFSANAGLSLAELDAEAAARGVSADNLLSSGTVFVSSRSEVTPTSAWDEWEAELREAIAEGTNYTADELFVDAHRAALAHDAVIVAATAAHRLRVLQDRCGDDDDDDDECEALAADGGDDGASIARLIRGVETSGHLVGGNVSFYGDTGGRRQGSIVVQIGLGRGCPSSAVELFSGGWHLPFFLPPVWNASAVRVGENAWEACGLEVPPSEPVFVEQYDTVPLGTRIAVMTASAAAALFCVACMAMTLRHRGLPIMRMSSYRINLLSAFGGLVMLAPAFFTGDDVSRRVCGSWVMMSISGFTLLFAPLFAKAYRVYRIFGSETISSIRGVTDRKLLKIVALLVLVDAAILAAWGATVSDEAVNTAPQGRPRVDTENPGVFVVPVHAECDTGHTAVLAVFVAWRGVVLAAGSYLAYKTRGVEIPALNDAKWTGLSIYTASLVSAIVLPLQLVYTDNHSRAPQYVLSAMAALFTVVPTVALLFVPKLLAIRNGTDDQWTHSDESSCDGTGLAPGLVIHRAATDYSRRRTSSGSAGVPPPSPTLSSRTLGRAQLSARVAPLPPLQPLAQTSVAEH